MNKEKYSKEILEEKMDSEGYVHIDKIASYSKKQYSEQDGIFRKGAKNSLHSFLFGRAFNHVDAYNFSAIAKIWSEEMLCKEDKNFVISIPAFFSVDIYFDAAETLKKRNLFDKFFEENRIEICRKAAEELGLLDELMGSMGIN